MNMEPRQLGTLHGRMAYVMALAQRIGPEAIGQGLWQGLWDLDFLVSHIPDVGFHRQTGRVVPATHGRVQKGLKGFHFCEQRQGQR